MRRYRIVLETDQEYNDGVDAGISITIEGDRRKRGDVMTQITFNLYNLEEGDKFQDSKFVSILFGEEKIIYISFTRPKH